MFTLIYNYATHKHIDSILIDLFEMGIPINAIEHHMAKLVCKTLVTCIHLCLTADRAHYKTDHRIEK